MCSPTGICHGLYCPEPTLLLVGVTSEWDPANEIGCSWKDPTLEIPWPFTEAVVSERDGALPPLSAILHRVGRFHITLTYVASFAVLALVRAGLTGHPVLAELAPLTGPMYQLFLFFMVTDPKTTVRGKKGQCLVVFLVAVVECAPFHRTSILMRLARELGVIARVMYSSPSVFCGIVSSIGINVVPVATAPVMVCFVWTMSPVRRTPGPITCTLEGAVAHVRARPAEV